MMPKVSVLVVTYLKENQKYLDLCLRSILNLNYPKDQLDVLVLSTGDYEPETMGFRSLHTTRHMHFPEGVNYGVSMMDKDSKHILILNDDTILTKNSLGSMVNAVGDHECIVGPISNCDNHWKYNLPSIGYFENGNFKPLQDRFYRYDALAPIADRLMDYQIPSWPGLWKQDWIAFYATLFPRKTWEKLGGLDPKFQTGQDDIDMCQRAYQHKIPVFIEQSSLIWHFGGTTADVVLNDEIRNSNIEYFKQKWGTFPT